MQDGLESTQVNSLMAAYRAGQVDAGTKLVEIFYPELKRMAGRQLQGERMDHSWQPTVLVNELYLRIVKVNALKPLDSQGGNDRAAFFALAGQMMRRLLIDHARPLAKKAKKVPLWDEIRNAPESELAEVECVLDRLATIKPVLRQVVEMKVFHGLTAEEIASKLGCAPVSVHRYWQFSRHWLARELSV